MKVNKKDILLIIVIVSAPFLIIGLVKSISYLHWKATASTEDFIKVHLEDICEERKITNSCTKELKKIISDTIDEALEKDDSSICERIEPGLRFACYYEFAKELGFTFNEVFTEELEGQDEELCINAKGLYKKKCYFNLAIEQVDDTFCEKTEEYRERCEANIELIKKKINPKTLHRTLRSRETVDEQIVIKLSQIWNPDSYFLGIERLLKVYNAGSKKLDGDKINVHHNFKLVDVDGCRYNSVVYPARSGKYNRHGSASGCYLELVRKIDYEAIEVTYDGETVLVISYEDI